MAATTTTVYAPPSAERDVDYSTASLLGLVFAGLILIGFIFMPWHGIAIVDNAAKLLADFLSGVAGSTVTPVMVLAPLAAVIGIGLALWGVLKPESGRLVSLLTMALGLAIIAACLLRLAEAASTEDAPAPGLGFWTILAGGLGMALQAMIAVPRVNAGLQVTQTRLSRHMPAIPRKWIPYLFLLPPLILYLIWIIGPTFVTFYLSLTNWDGITNPSYVGLANFQRLFTQDRNFSESLINNARWLVVFITVPTSLGLGLALIFNTEMRGGRFYKVSFYSPLVLSFAVIALVWTWLYNPRLGLINSFLVGIGVSSPPGWLGDRELAIWCVIAAAVWRQVGYVMVLYLAGLKNIDPTLVDAALVDGADRWNLFRRVVLPLLAPVTTIVIVISIIDSLRAFDLVAIMTRGGQSTQVLANVMYIEAFNNYRMGYAGAIAVVLFAISMVFIGFYLSRVVKDELEY